jgi:hypothetical protein
MRRLEYVTIASYATSGEAATVRDVLQSQGILSSLAASPPAPVEPVWGIALGNVGLQVPRGDAARALEVVREHRVATLAEADAVPSGTEDACVACGAAFPAYLDRCPACGLSYG